MKKAKVPFIITVLILVCVLFFRFGFWERVTQSISLVFVSLDDVLDRRKDFVEKEGPVLKRSNFYKDKVVKILIVPGHDDEFFGAEFDGVKEVYLNRKVGEKLYTLLDKESGLEVVLASDENGYRKDFEKYFEEERDSIQDFIKESGENFREKVANGKFELVNKNLHNYAPSEVVHKLYGINRWVNENKFDLVIHIHFNDYSGRYRHKIPKYNGMAVYIPDKQFKNYELSKNLADSILNRLNDFIAISNSPAENVGVVEDNELIAIGANETLGAGVILVEYGYIYEKQYSHPDLSEFVLDELARLTYLGVKDLFGEDVGEPENKYIIKKDLSQSVVRSKDNLVLQYQLSKLGKYPPKGKTLNNCPIAGYFGECTKRALIDFQRENNLPPTGYFGDMTKSVLNNY